MFVTSVGVGKKKHFCNTFQNKIIRHFEGVHGNELEVQKFKDILKETAERKKIIETICKRGDFYFNVNCARNELLKVKRCSKKEYG